MSARLLAVMIIASVSGANAADPTFLEYCTGDLTDKEKHTLEVLVVKAEAPSEDLDETNCAVLEARIKKGRLLSVNREESVSRDQGLTDLTFLKFFPHLQSTELRGHPVSDLTPLKALPKLMIVDVRDTDVSDLSPLAGLSKLVSVKISGTKVTEIGALGDVVIGQIIALIGQKLNLSDWDQLQKATKLEIVDVGGSNVENVEPFKNSPGIVSLKLLQTRKLKSIAGIEGLTKLSEFFVSAAPLTELNLEKNLAIRELLIEELDLKKPLELSHLKRLNRVSLDSNRLTEIPELAPDELVHLSLWHNPGITDLSPVAKLTNLTNLYLMNTKVVDLEPLKGLVKLVEVDLRGTAILDVKALSSLTDMENLHLGETLLTEEQAKTQLADLVKAHANSSGTEISLNIHVIEMPDIFSPGL